MNTLGADAVWAVQEGYLMLSIIQSRSLLADFLREIELIKVSL